MKLERSLKKGEIYKEYELLSSLIFELPELTNNSISAALSGYSLAEFILKDIKTNNLPKRFEHDLTGADFGDFKNDELKTLGELTKFTKENRNIKSNKFFVFVFYVHYIDLTMLRAGVCKTTFCVRLCAERWRQALSFESFALCTHRAVQQPWSWYRRSGG